MNERPRQYATAAAFRVALETRLKSVATAEGVDLQRLRRQVSFDRLLARFFAEPNAPWLLKGGYAMELRLRTARTTKDIDISLPTDLAGGFAGEILARLQQSAGADLETFLASRSLNRQCNVKRVLARCEPGRPVSSEPSIEMSCPPCSSGLHPPIRNKLSVRNATIQTSVAAIQSKEISHINIR